MDNEELKAKLAVFIAYFIVFGIVFIGLSALYDIVHMFLFKAYEYFELW